MGEYSWLTHSSIDSGSKVDLLGYTNTYSFDNFITVSQEPGKDVGSDYNFRLGMIDYTGHDNPKFVIEGIVMSGLTTNDQGSVCITLQRLGSFAMIGSPSWFYDPEIMLNPAGSCPIFIQTFKIEKPLDVTNVRRYTMTVFETRSGANWT